MIEVIHTSEVSGVSKSISSAFAYLACAIAAFKKYAPALDTKHGHAHHEDPHQQCRLRLWVLFTGQQDEVISATPVTP